MPPISNIPRPPKEMEDEMPVATTKVKQVKGTFLAWAWSVVAVIFGILFFVIGYLYRENQALNKTLLNKVETLMTDKINQEVKPKLDTIQHAVTTAVNKVDTATQQVNEQIQKSSK